MDYFSFYKIIILKFISHSKHIHVCIALISSPFLSQMFFFSVPFLFLSPSSHPRSHFFSMVGLFMFQQPKGGTDEEKVSRSLRMCQIDVTSASQPATLFGVPKASKGLVGNLFKALLVVPVLKCLNSKAVVLSDLINSRW